MTTFTVDPAGTRCTAVTSALVVTHEHGRAFLWHVQTAAHRDLPLQVRLEALVHVEQLLMSSTAGRFRLAPCVASTVLDLGVANDPASALFTDAAALVDRSEPHSEIGKARLRVNIRDHVNALRHQLQSA